MRSLRDRAAGIRWAVAACLIVWLVVFSAVASAADACDGTWRLVEANDPADLGFTATLGPAASACVNEAARVYTFGGTQSSCSVSGGFLTETGITGGSQPYTYKWQALPVGCGADSGGGASSPNVGNVTLVLPDFLNLSASDGLALSVAILTVWATAFAWRALMRVLNAADGRGEEE